MAKSSKINKSSTKKVKAGTPLTAQQARTSLKNLTDWRLSDNNKMIYREYVIKDFMAAIHLISHIAGIAEDEKRHSKILLTDYRKMRVELTTHDVGGLSENDFLEARKINELPVALKR